MYGFPTLPCESHKCGNVARFAVSEHNVNDCGTYQSKVRMLCKDCTRELSDCLENMLANMWTGIETWDMKCQAPHCTTCKRSLFALHDVLDVELI